jgi:2'-deoxynucleoside 5'-phosphate N-hydrolase
MIAYISVSFNKRKALDAEVTAIIRALREFSVSAFVFVDEYNFDPSQEREMMHQALTDIGKCDLLIAETSHKAIGVGIEVGYAKAKKKPIIYLRNNNAEHSTTVSGISDFQVIYSNAHDLTTKLSEVLSCLKSSRSR